MFYIGFVSAPRVNEEGWPHAMGLLTLGDAQESFEADLREWTTADYEAQWREGIARLASGTPSSALITSYGGRGGITGMWPIWREGATAYLQERLIVPGETGPPFNPERPYEQVGVRRTASEDGAISEWALPLGQLLAFVLEG